jgi:hypothetical protein
LTGPVLLIGYFSRIGLTTVQWKKMFGTPSLIFVLSLIVLVFSPFPEFGGAAALIAFANSSILPSFFIAKLLNL